TSKIIIIRGGIIGLTLVIILKKFEIKYILLETYNKIAPAGSNSIGLFPNTFRIYN
ncbi:uncharacterized protein CLUP02_08021, partial [Colletotrichum lupini]